MLSEVIAPACSLHWRHLDIIIKQVREKTIEGSENVLLTWRNEVKQVTEVNPTLTWNDKLEREIVFASSQSSCKRRRVISYTADRLETRTIKCWYSDNSQGLCVYVNFTYSLVNISCPGEALCLWGSSTLPLGRSFWDNEALLFKDSWAQMSCVVNETCNWN